MNPTNSAPYQGDQKPGNPPSYEEATGQHSQNYAPYPQIYVDHSPSAPPFRDWGASVIGSPSNPSVHPDNQQAALKKLGHPDESSPAPEGFNPEQRASYGVPGSEGQAFVQNTASGDGKTSHEGQAESSAAKKKPLDNIMENLNKWGKKAEDVAGNVWTHLRTGPSISDTAWGRLNQGAKLLKEGGLEKVYKQSFDNAQDEQLKKSYACYLSTSTGPVVGTLYISNVKFAFCSDRPLQHISSDQQQASTYYKVIIPLDKVKAVHPSANKDKPAEKYIQIVTLDDHEFWFMGFVNYDKGLKNLQEAIVPKPST